MKVAIVGPGALGCYIVSKLVHNGVEAVLVDYKSDRIDRLNRSGITLEQGGQTIQVRPKVVSGVPSGSSLVIVCVKSHHSKGLQIEGAPEVLTLQGGLGNVETLCAKVGSANILAGTLTDTAVLVDEGYVKCTYPGKIRFGSWTSCPTTTAERALSQGGFDVEVTDAPGQSIWESVAVQSGIEPLTALLGVPNGRIVEIPTARQLMRDLVVESVKVASTEGYRFNHSLVEVAEERCVQTKNHVSTMLQDVRQGKTTEIEAVSGEILRRAQHAALPTPRTRVVWQLLQGIEQR